MKFGMRKPSLNKMVKAIKQLEEKREYLNNASDILISSGVNATVYDMQADSIDHFFCAGGIENYTFVRDFCLRKKIKKIFDIGCAYGHQSACFEDTEIEYVGVDEYLNSFYNSDKYNYIHDHFPCELPSGSGDLAVSILCLTWNCYAYDGERTIEEQCRSLANQFEHALLYVYPEGVKAMKKYFSNVEPLEGNFYYFYN